MKKVNSGVILKSLSNEMRVVSLFLIPTWLNSLKLHMKFD